MLNTGSFRLLAAHRCPACHRRATTEREVRIVHVVAVGGRRTNGIAFHDALTGKRFEQLDLRGLIDQDVDDEKRWGRRRAVHRQRSGRRTFNRGFNQPFARHVFAAFGQGTQQQFNVNRGPDHRERFEVLVSVRNGERCVDRTPPRRASRTTVLNAAYSPCSPTITVPA